MECRVLTTGPPGDSLPLRFLDLTCFPVQGSSLLLPAKQKILVLHQLEINWSPDCQRVGVGRVESWPLLSIGVLSAVPSASMSRPSLQLLGDLGRKTGGQFLG